MKQNVKLVIVTRTQQFIVQGVGLWGNGKIIYRHETLNTLIETDSITLKFKIRKTEKWGKTYTKNQQDARDTWQPYNTGYTTS